MDKKRLFKYRNVSGRFGFFGSMASNKGWKMANKSIRQERNKNVCVCTFECNE